MEMNRKLRFAVPLAAVLLVGACTSGEGPTGLAAYPDVSGFTKANEPNGPGACLLAETQAAGFLNNVNDLNCTSNDVDISFAKVSEYRINGIGAFIPLAEGDKIECTPGDKIEVQTSAFVQNSAQARYDLGFWVNLVHGGSALTGASCEHFNLVPGKGGSTTEEDGKNSTVDFCGDMKAGVLAEIDLGTLNLVCPGGGATSLDLDACAAWQNSTTGGNDRFCPIGNVDSREAFGRGTTPGTTAKCRCEPLNLPIVVKAGVELRKVWEGTPGQTTLRIGTSAGGNQVSGDVQTGANGGAPLTTGSFPVDPGTYFFSETGGLADYTSTLSCVLNGGAPFTPGGGSVAVVGGDNLVCTFTNTRDEGSIELKKVWVGVQGQTTLRIGTSAGGNQVSGDVQTGADGGPPLSTGAETVNTGTYFVSETGGLDGYTTELACTRNGNAFVPGAQNSVVVNKEDVVVCTFTNTLILVTEWCSPGYWKNAKWDFWTFLGIPSNTLYSTLPSPGGIKPPLKSGGDATLAEILASPQTYGGPAFNYVGSFLSDAHPDIDFVLGAEVPEEHECPINAFGEVESES